MNVEEFAANIETVADGILLSSSVQDPRQAMLQTLQIYKVATKVN